MRQIVLSVLFVSLTAVGFAQVIDNTSSRVQTSLDPGLKHLGTLVPKHVREIETSRWTLGCETIDREYSDYNAFKAYLPPLGIRRIRLQGGWARTEKDPGIDIITGNVYEIPAGNVRMNGEMVIFKEIPVYDAPAFIMDGDALTFRESPALIYECSKHK